MKPFGVNERLIRQAGGEDLKPEAFHAQQTAIVGFECHFYRIDSRLYPAIRLYRNPD
ncbi:hypothetical protein D3C73_1603080 [compost metagenome]